MEAKKIHCVLDSIAKTICWIQHQKRIKAKKMVAMVKRCTK